MLPGNQVILWVESRGDPVIPHGTVVAPFDIILPGPDHFDRFFDLFGDLDSLDDEIRLRVCPAAEAATQKSSMERNLLGLEARDPRRGIPIGGLELGAGPDLAAVGA